MVAFVAPLMGCIKTRRSANRGLLAGGQITRSGSEATPSLGSGAFVANAQVVDSSEHWTARGRLDLTLGGSDSLAADAQAGFRVLGEENDFFVRAGIYGSVQGGENAGFAILELPTLWFGFQHHGEAKWPGIHFDIGPRLSLATTGRNVSDGESFRFAAAPTVGAAALAMGKGWSLEGTYFRIFESEPVDVFRLSMCGAFAIALCVEARHVIAPGAGGRAASTYVGIRIGIGFIDNVSYHASAPW